MVDQVERSFIRSAIASMPRDVKLVALVVIVVGTYFFGSH
ncbi:hypothetical protein ACUXLG_005664 [Ralstonia sp. 121560039-2]